MGKLKDVTILSLSNGLIMLRGGYLSGKVRPEKVSIRMDKRLRLSIQDTAFINKSPGWAGVLPNRDFLFLC